MNSPALPGSADRLAATLDGLCRAVAASLGGLMQVPMILLVWRRLRRAESRLMALMALVAAGRWRRRESGGKAGIVRVVPDDGSPVRPMPRERLPRRFGWLVAAMPHVAAGYAQQLRALLGEADMIVLLRDVPEAARILAPICRMLGLEAGLLAPVCAAVPAACSRRRRLVAEGPAYVGRPLAGPVAPVRPARSNGD